VLVSLTLWRQCWFFMIGSSFFAVGTAPGFGILASATATNALCFIGSWFFTSAAIIQLVRSTPPTSPGWSEPARRADWLSALIQFAGTVMFNISTGAALLAHRPVGERRFVWAPDAFGSVAFLVSGVLAVLAVSISVGVIALQSRDWHAAWLNMIGCVAFGVSSYGAFVTREGITVDALLANAGTFMGAVCFFIAAYLVLPDRSDTSAYGVAS
jgi:uncharacterized membrane protein YhaH (DUF805 family)